MPELGERERLIEAMVDIVLERGYEAATIDLTVERAELGEAAFRRHFADMHECFAQIYTRNNDSFAAPIFAAYEGGETWRDSLRAAAYAAARFLRDHPRETRFNVIALLEAGDMLQAERDRYLQSMIDLIDAGRQELVDPDSMTRSAAEGAFGAIFGSLLKEVQQSGGTRSAESYVPALMYLAVRPYLGHEVAREELGIPPPPEPDPVEGRA